MTPETLRERIMARIEQDQAIHASSLDEEIVLFLIAFHAHLIRTGATKTITRIDWDDVRIERGEK